MAVLPLFSVLLFAIGFTNDVWFLGKGYRFVGNFTVFPEGKDGWHENLAVKL